MTRSIAAIVALFLASVVPAAAVTVTVDGHAMPWLPATSGSPFGIGDGIGPTVVPVIAGGSITFTYLGGATDAFNPAGSGIVDATGYPGFDSSGNNGTSTQPFPSKYADPFTYPIFLNALIGDFVDAAGNPILLSGYFAFAPFPADSSVAFMLTVPTGAAFLQLGVNDDVFSDNAGALRIGLEGNGISAVPGPIVGAGMPGLIAAFGGIGIWWRRRKALAA